MSEIKRQIRMIDRLSARFGERDPLVVKERLRVARLRDRESGLRVAKLGRPREYLAAWREEGVRRDDEDRDVLRVEFTSGELDSWIAWPPRSRQYSDLHAICEADFDALKSVSKRELRAGVVVRVEKAAP